MTATDETLARGIDYWRDQAVRERVLRVRAERLMRATAFVAVGSLFVAVVLNIALMVIL